MTRLFPCQLCCKHRSVGHVLTGTLPRSACAVSASKNPASQPVQDVRNIQIVKEQKSSKEKLSFRLKTCRATALSVIHFFADRGAVSRRIACYASASATKSCGKWWSQAGSNRRPPACKAGALPAELWPRCYWWVWEDLNFRPHPYQGCALTN